jgi:hypothetical protein
VQLFATTPNLQKILFTLETQTPYTVIENVTVRPLNAFRGFKPPPGNEPELSVLLDVSAFAFPEPKTAEAAKSTDAKSADAAKSANAAKSSEGAKK